MASENILRSYLMSIGFEVDEQAYRRFKDTQDDQEKRVKNLGASLERFAAISATAATVLGGSVIKITDRLTALYYNSQLAGSSAKNLQAFTQAAEQIGISAESAQGAVEGLASAIRLNPGLTGMLRALNVNPNQDRVKVLLDLVDRLKQLPFYQASQIASMFGIDEQTLYLMEAHRDELHRYYTQMQELNKATDEQSRSSREFHNRLKQLEDRFNILWQIIATRLLPYGEQLVSQLTDAVNWLISADKATEGWSSKILGLGSAILGTVGGLKILRGLLGGLGIGGAAGGSAVGIVPALGTTMAIGGAIGAKALRDRIVAKTGSKVVGDLAESYVMGLINPFFMTMPGPGGAQDLWDKFRKSRAPDWEMSVGYTSSDPASSKSDLVNFYAKRYGLDPSLLRAVIREEHGMDAQGNAVVSPKGAIGIMQLMPETAKVLGVNPYNNEENLAGGAHYLSDLMKKYGGNELLALAAYNAGPGAVDKYQGIPPYKETQDYVSSILGYQLAGVSRGSPDVTVSSKTDIHVNGARDPQAVADDVLDGQDRVNATALRNGKGAVR